MSSRRPPPGSPGLPGLAVAVLLAVHLAAPVPAAPAPASEPAADTVLTAAYPAADTVHVLPVEEIRLRFSTAVQPSLSTISVIGPAGVLPGLPPVEGVPGSGAREIRVQLPSPLPSGAYTVEWRTAGPDSHPVRGSHSFRVERPGVEPSGDPPGAGVPGRRSRTGSGP